jgi:hypothetical protein
VVQQIQLRTEGRENGDLGAVASYSGVMLNLQMSETHILIRLLWMYFPWNWDFATALKNRQRWGGGGRSPQTPPRYTTDIVIKMYDVLSFPYISLNISDLRHKKQEKLYGLFTLYCAEISVCYTVLRIIFVSAIIYSCIELI